MDDAIEMRHLRYFIAVAEELHFGRAAARLHMAQPPLSQQIRKLETLIGAKLFTRTSRVVALTPAGAAFLTRSRRLIAQSESDVDEAARIGRGEGGRLDVGFVSSALILGAVDLIHQFHSRYPDVLVQLHEGFTSQLVAQVVDHRVDVAFVRDPDPHPELSASTLLTEEFVAVVPAGHYSAGQDFIPASALRNDPFVFYPRAAGERAFRRNMQPCLDAGYLPRIVQEASNWTTILHLVGAGLGVTIAPISATATAPNNVRIIPLRHSLSTSEVQYIRRSNDNRPLLDNFLGGR
jgi:DNA-binding transcriptional LysR family regulator